MVESFGLGAAPLQDKTAIVTGIGPGIGSHVANAYADAGANVVLVARGAGKVQALADAINARGGHALAFPGDVGKKEDLDALIAAAREAYGAVDILFHNAAGNMTAPRETALQATDEDWELGFTVNLLAPFRLAKALVPGMKERGEGSIINVLTTAAFTPVLPFVAYGATKAGLAMLTRYLAKECGPEVRVNAICPGTISADGEALDVWKPLLPSIPLGRIGMASEVAPAALFLASRASSYITGQVLFVDGGRVSTAS